MTSRTVAEKLQIKPGDVVAVDPGASAMTGDEDALRSLLEPLPVGARFDTGDEQADVAFRFVAGRAELDQFIADGLDGIDAARIAWLVYPKGNRSDINRDSAWQRLGEVGWTLTSNIAVDDTWSALRLKRL